MLMVTTRKNCFRRKRIASFCQIGCLDLTYLCFVCGKQINKTILKMSLLRSTRTVFLLSKVINNVTSTVQTRSIKRWVAPTLRELRKRAKKLGPQDPQPRSSFIEWNYRAELFAFGKRLNEEFHIPKLQTAFTQRSHLLQEQQKQRELGIEEEDINVSEKDNSLLATRGKKLAEIYVSEFLQNALPKVPEVGHAAFSRHLTDDVTLAHVASHLGMGDLIRTAEYPPSIVSLAHSLCAVIGALEESSGAERSFLFVRDFICTQLNQRDLLELWLIEKPEEFLKKVCEDRKMSFPEPRLIGDCGRNTVLAAYQVGIYADKHMIGKGFGEDIPTAVNAASLDALQNLFGLQDYKRPFNFQMVQPKILKVTQN